MTSKSIGLHNTGYFVAKIELFISKEKAPMGRLLFFWSLLILGIDSLELGFEGWTILRQLLD